MPDKPKDRLIIEEEAKDLVRLVINELIDKRTPVTAPDEPQTLALSIDGRQINTLNLMIPEHIQKEGINSEAFRCFVMTNDGSNQYMPLAWRASPEAIGSKRTFSLAVLPRQIT